MATGSSLLAALARSRVNVEARVARVRLSCTTRPGAHMNVMFAAFIHFALIADALRLCLRALMQLYCGSRSRTPSLTGTGIIVSR